MGGMRKRVRLALLVSLAALGSLTLPGPASAAEPPECDPAFFPTSFLLIDGSHFIGNTRYFKLKLNPRNTDSIPAQSDPEYPGTLTIDPSNGPPTTFPVTNYARNEFPAAFATGETDLVTVRYTEIHTDYAFRTIVINTRCTRVLAFTFKKPPVIRLPRAPRGGRPPGRDDGQGQGQSQGQGQGQGQGQSQGARKKKRPARRAPVGV